MLILDEMNIEWRRLLTGVDKIFNFCSFNHNDGSNEKFRMSNVIEIVDVYKENRNYSIQNKLEVSTSKNLQVDVKKTKIPGCYESGCPILINTETGLGSIEKVTRASFNPNQSIDFKAGGTW